MSRQILNELGIAYYAAQTQEECAAILAQMQPYIQTRLEKIATRVKARAPVKNEIDDLVQESWTHLLENMNTFDPAWETFSSYCTWAARAARKKIDECIIHIPLRILHEAKKFLQEYEPREAIRVLTSMLKEYHDTAEHAAHLIHNTLRQTYETIDDISDSLRTDDEGEVIEVPCRGPSYLPEFEEIDEYIVLEHALKTLDDREREILLKRFGLNDQEEKTLREVGCEVGLNRERVRQIENEAIHKLRKAIAGRNISKLIYSILGNDKTKILVLDRNGARIV